MFLFLVARTPVCYRTPIREKLWEISKISLLNQTSKNWKAIIIGDVSEENLDTEFFITLNYDLYSKQEKLYKHIGFVPFAHLLGDEKAQFQPMFITHQTIKFKYEKIN